VWNACGLRIGSIVTDNKEFQEKAVAEYTANLCANAIGQYVFGSLAHENKASLVKWYKSQRNYYKPIMDDINVRLKKNLPGVIMSSPDAAIYSVIDVRNIAKPGFSSIDFVLFCCREGQVFVNGKNYTLLTAPMSGFYNVEKGEVDPGSTQMRIAYVETPDRMALLPDLFAELFRQYNRK
jgi:aspartate aminotransferase